MSATASPSASPARSAVSVELDEQRVATLTLDVPGQSVNTFSRATFEAFEAAITAVEATCEEGHCDALIIRSGKPGTFIAGAELKEFGQIDSPELAREAIARGQGLFARLEALPVPTAAVITGVCVGGGLEMAMACTFRVGEHSESGYQLGLPEIKLGIVPAWGGTQRLPRRVGLARAVRMITAGQLIDARRAKRIGLLDALVSPGSGVAEARRLCAEAAREGLLHANPGPFAPTGGRWSRRRPPQSWLDWLLGSVVGRTVLFGEARKQVLKATGGHYPAPLEALRCLEAGAWSGADEGYAVEARVASELITGDISRNLVRLFFLGEQIRKDPGVDGWDEEPARIGRLGVLGAGTMGGGIAQLAAYNKVPVRVRDVAQPALDVAAKTIGGLFDQAVKKRKLDRRQRANRASLISLALDLRGFGACDLVVEAVVENLDVKRKVLAEAEARLPETAILASNTSSLSIDAMAEALQRPERLVGLHFFNPVHKMQLVEVVRGAQTSDEVVVAAVAFAKRLGKKPVVVKDAPGFLVNRVLMPLMDESARLLLEGWDPEKIDDALIAFGLPMGAFALLDTVGVDVAAKVARTFADAFGDRVSPPELLDGLVAAGRLGRKSGGGIYAGGKRERGIAPELWSLLPREARARRAPDEDEVVDRVVLRMVTEAVRCLDEGVARSVADVDAAMVFGTGFAPFRGGPLAYLDARGATEIAARLDELAAAHGPRFEAPDGLHEVADRVTALH